MRLGRSRQVQQETAPVVVELSPETKEELLNLTSEIHVAIEILDDLLGRANALGQAVKVDLGKHIQIVPDAPEPQDAPKEKGNSKADSRRRVPESSRVRESPFTRRPISEQYDWILGLLADGQWHTSAEIAHEYATDDRHHRYLKGAVNGRMGELYRMGKLERGDSAVRGSMFAYRIPPK